MATDFDRIEEAREATAGMEYERWTERVADEYVSGLCFACKNDQAMSGEDFCMECAGDVEGEIAAYERSDPKSPGFHDNVTGLWDDRDKVAP